MCPAPSELPIFTAPYLPKHVIAPPKKLKHRGFLYTNRAALAMGAMACAGLMTSIPTLPASAEVIHAEVTKVIPQSFTVSPVAYISIERSSFTVSYYTVVQAPVPLDSPISSGFGHRIPPCAECSSVHEGDDFTPGEGHEVVAIADGVVTDIGNPSGTMGVYVSIKHVIDGDTITSVYAHMKRGSMPLAIGDKVTHGQVVGRVGSTGQSTGPHLYFEIRVANGKAVNPFPWLLAHVNS